MWPKWKENELAEIIQMKRDYQIVAFHQGEQWFEWCPLRSSAWMRRAQQRDASSHSSSTDNSLDLIISSRGNVGESPSRFKLQVRAVEEDNVRTVLYKHGKDSYFETRLRNSTSLGTTLALMRMSMGGLHLLSNLLAARVKVLVLNPHC